MNVSCVSLYLPLPIETHQVRVCNPCASTSTSSLIEIYMYDACVRACVRLACVCVGVYCHKRRANCSNGIEGMTQMIWYVMRRPLSQTTVDLTTTLNKTPKLFGRTTFRIIHCKVSRLQHFTKFTLQSMRD